MFNDRMKSRIIKLIMILFVLLIGNNAYSGGWYMIHENDQFDMINKAVSRDFTLQYFYAVGDNGKFYSSNNWAYSWEMYDTPVASNLFALDVFELYPDTFVVAAGQGGDVLRSTDGGKTWVNSKEGADNFNAVFYDIASFDFWIGGDNGSIHYSINNGASWLPATAGDNTANIVDFVATLNDLYLIAVKNDSSFIMRKTGASQFKAEIGDTIPGVQLTSAFYLPSMPGAMYLAGNSTETGLGVVWKKDEEETILQPPVEIFTGIEGFVTDIDGYEDVEQGSSTIWVTTDNGQVWEFSQEKATWKLIYSDISNRNLSSIVVNLTGGAGNEYGRIIGIDGLVLKYGFELLNCYPDNNAQIDSIGMEIALKFSAIPDLTSIQNGVFIQSSVSGGIPFTAKYDGMDSLLVLLENNRPHGGGTIPGEKWNISLSAAIAEAGVAEPEPFWGFNYDIDFMPPQSEGFNFSKAYLSDPINSQTSNFVSGLFNNDNGFDLITFSFDSLSLYCYGVDEAGNFNSYQKINLNLSPFIKFEPEITNQLILSDVNSDSKPDLILYDRENIYLIKNGSTDFNFNFLENPTAYFDGTGIKQVLPYNADDNGLVDLLILTDDSLYTRINIDESSFGEGPLGVEVRVWEKMQCGDIDADGRQDFVLLDNSGSLTIRRGSGSGLYSDDVTVGAGYVDVRLADINNDRMLEIIARDSLKIDIWLYDFTTGWTFNNSVSLVQSDPQKIKDFVIHDFGEYNPGFEKYMDIALITAEKQLKYFENGTTIPEEVIFSECSMDDQQSISFPVEGLLQNDFNKDAILDLIVFNKNPGKFEAFIKKPLEWRPSFYPETVMRDSVALTWTSFPDEMGESFLYYRLVRDTVSEFSEDCFSYNVYNKMDTVFVDHGVEPYRSYWYAVQAIYGEDIATEWSDPISVEMFNELNGNQQGVLDDTTRIYLAKSQLHIPNGESLVIQPGVEIVFMPGTGLDVFGSLEVQGGAMEQMVSFHGCHYEEQSWNGIVLHASADTVRFEWFSIDGAFKGIESNSRPLKMRFGGLNFNQTALEFQGDSLSLEHVIIDSNIIGLSIGDGARAEIKNINILHSMQNSLTVSGVSQTNVRNAIIWDNFGTVLNNSTQAQLSIKYSTVDSIQGVIVTNEISKQPPVFMPPDSGYYRADFTSPTIDAGDPNDDYSLEPIPNGGRINQGIFGGSLFATPSFRPVLAVNNHQLFAQAKPGLTDTTQLVIKNAGAEELAISDIKFLRQIPQFELLSETIFAIAPYDSVIIDIVFKPDTSIEYNDTLVISSNDPNYADDGFLVPVQGIGLTLNIINLVINPSQVITQVKTGFSDTTQLDIMNAGLEDVEISDIKLSRQIPQFELLSDTSYTLESGVSVVINIVFKPNESIVYLDTLVITCNDLVNVEKFIVPVQGTGLPPIADDHPPQIVVTDKPGLIVFQAAVRFEFHADDTSGVTTGDDESLITKHYRLIDIGSGQTIVKRDTAGINEVVLYPLKDGSYRFELWASDTEGNGLDSSEANVAHYFFAVTASKRSVKSYRWYMLSLPRPNTINWHDFYSDSAAMLLRWDSSANEYIPLDNNEIPVGAGFWMFPVDSLSFDLNEYPHASDDDSLYTSIQVGWNQIGIPVGYSVNWNDMKFIPNNTGDEGMSIEEAVNNSLLENAVYWYQQTSNYFGYNWTKLDTSQAAPWCGYWLKANEEGTLVFSTKPSFRQSVNSNVNPNNIMNLSKSGNDWQMNISLKNKNYADMKNIIGISNQSRGSVYEPPHFGEFCSLFFRTEKGQVTEKFEKEFEDHKDVRSWDVTIASRNDALDHTLSWQNDQLNPECIYVYLVDLQKEVIIDMNDQQDYTFKPEGGEYRFQVYATMDASFSPEIIPLEYRLKQNYPNPFNPITTIRFGVPQTADGKRVVLKIYDILGREVVKLIDKTMKMGYHEITWKGRNNSDKPAASGVYFYQFICGKERLVKKMVLIR